MLLEQTQGGLALASNSYRYGGHFSHSLRLGAGGPISFTASVSPECEFVRLEFYAPGEETPFLTVNKTRVDMHWAEAANAIVRAVTRPKDEYKLRLETKVAPTGTPGDDCPGYIVVEDARTIGTLSYHGPKRYYPRDGWVRLRPVANPGYRFVKWETSEDVTGATLGGWGTPPSRDINGLEDEKIALRMQADTTITAVFDVPRVVNFRLSSSPPNPHWDNDRGILHVEYTWDSSTGNGNDLVGQEIFEVLTYNINAQYTSDILPFLENWDYEGTYSQGVATFNSFWSQYFPPTTPEYLLVGSPVSAGKFPPTNGDTHTKPPAPNP